MKKWPRRLFRPRTNHARHQKPNPSRETVPVMGQCQKNYFINKKNSLTVDGAYLQADR
jgi:hypothetical protein